MSKPTFNHTRGDGPASPCPTCARDMIEEKMMELAHSYSLGEKAVKTIVNHLADLPFLRNASYDADPPSKISSDALVLSVELLRAAVAVWTSRKPDDADPTVAAAGDYLTFMFEGKK